MGPNIACTKITEYCINDLKDRIIIILNKVLNE